MVDINLSFPHGDRRLGDTTAIPDPMAKDRCVRIA